MSQKEKIRVTWVCSFENEEVANLLGAKFTKSISPWITDLIELFRDKTDIELSIITPNYYTNKNSEVKINNITIYLFQYRPFYLPPRAYNLVYNYSFTRKNIAKIIETIVPDLIHLHGSENPLYSAGVLPLLNKYPVLVTIQGFISLSMTPRNWLSRYIRWNRIRYERKINSNATFFTNSAKDDLQTLRAFNKSAIAFEQPYPTKRPDLNLIGVSDKEYDLVFYARITKAKGIEDFINAVKILKIDQPDIKAIIIGGGAKRYVENVKSLVRALNLSKNIIFAGFQPTQQDVFRLATRAKVYVLPTYFDVLPGSIRESMFLKIPVVAYAVGGIPSLNDDKKCITLAEKGNIKELVEKIGFILRNDIVARELVDNAYELITNKYDNNKIYSNLLSIYNKILN
jgi:glycosyltransferase involved in cell wall biosynthesis